MTKKSPVKEAVQTNSSVDSIEVLRYIEKRGIVSTNEVATKFRIRPQQAAANLAILRIKERIEPAAKPVGGKDKSSRWQLRSA